MFFKVVMAFQSSEWPSGQWKSTKTNVLYW